jgi:phage baseplate assembly protein W
MGYNFVNNNDISNQDISLGTSLRFQRGIGGFNKITLTEQQAIENLKHLLLTRKGEIFENPDFGSDLLLLIFEHTTDDIKENITDIINDAVSQWATYIKIIDVVTDIDVNASIVNINISFNVDRIPVPIDIGISVAPTGISVTTT